MFQRNSKMIIGIIFLLLPGMGFGQTVSLNAVLHAEGANFPGGNSVDFDPTVDTTVTFDVLLDTDTALDSIQFSISVNDGVDSDKWQTSANPWVMPQPFGQDTRGYAGFDYSTVDPPPAAPVVNDYISTIGDGSSGTQDQSSDYPNTILTQIATPELYFRMSGKSQVGSDLIVATYQLEPVGTPAAGTYVIKLTTDTLGIGCKWVIGAVSGAFAESSAGLTVNVVGSGTGDGSEDDDTDGNGDDTQDDDDEGDGEGDGDDGDGDSEDGSEDGQDGDQDGDGDESDDQDGNDDGDGTDTGDDQDDGTGDEVIVDDGSGTGDDTNGDGDVTGDGDSQTSDGDAIAQETAPAPTLMPLCGFGVSSIYMLTCALGLGLLGSFRRRWC